MEWVLALAAKSLILAGGTLLLLKAMHKRSAADRSWIAHLGLAALLLLPAAAFALPALNVEGPAFLAPPAETPVTAPASRTAEMAPEVAPATASFPEPVAAAAEPWSVGIDWTYAGYAVPAALLILLTLIAIGRLVALKARAQVLVDAHWLSALARAQRRMGFKNGTALLTSSELRSPVSWGLMRPVIVLNDDAAEARDDAEAIIAHELAHVARLDWAKLLLARVAVALFWFNPLVWLLAREAHQLREEAADDAVLGSDIDDTDYARLLVGVARHECNGLLLGAHGVAPSRNSLSRRVRRVLDQALTRAPGGWRWTSAAAFFAAGMAVPVAALNFVPTTPVSPVMAGSATVGGKANASPELAGAPPNAAAATAASASALAHPHADADNDSDLDEDMDVDVDIDDEMEQAGREIRAANREVAVAVAEARTALGAGAAAVAHPDRRDPLDEAIAAKMMGVTPDYVREMRAASPELRNVSMDDLISMRTHGVRPEFVRELRRAGQTDLSAKRLTSAAIQGVNARYIQEMASVGYGRASLKELTEMRMFGVNADYVRKFQRAGYRNLSAKQLVKMKTFGVQPDDVSKDTLAEP
jgi:beta-lactamase regulating signal transducer with metallopeptidase domain